MVDVVVVVVVVVVMEGVSIIGFLVDGGKNGNSVKILSVGRGSGALNVVVGGGGIGWRTGDLRHVPQASWQFLSIHFLFERHSPTVAQNRHHSCWSQQPFSRHLKFFVTGFSSLAMANLFIPIKTTMANK